MEKLEKIQDEPLTGEVFENDIEFYLRRFCEEQKIEDLRRESQNVWNGCLLYIKRHVFNNRNILKSSINISADNMLMPSSCNMYDYNLINDICDYYIYICNLYDKEVSIMGFSKLTGIATENIYNWGDEVNKLSSRGFDVFKKLKSEREESLSSKLVTGKQNPVGVLGVLNRHYQWNMPGVTKEHTGRQKLTSEQLPKLGENNTQFLIPSGE